VAVAKPAGLQDLPWGADGGIAKPAAYPREGLGQRRIHVSHVRKPELKKKKKKKKEKKKRKGI